MEISRLVRRCTLLLLVLCALPLLARSQERPKLTVEVMVSPETFRASALPTYQWLEDGRLVTYDRSRPPAERSVEVLNAETGERTPLVDPQKALASLRDLLGADRTPPALPFPGGMNATAGRAWYVFSGDIYLLDMPAGAFTRLTDTPEEEKNVSLSPDGSGIAFVRSKNLFVYDIGAKREVQLTSDANDSLLNGTLSWVYWEEVYGRRDEAYWWSPDSRAIAYLQTDESGVSIQHYVDVHPWTPQVATQRYPKVGEKNPRVRVGVVELASRSTVWANLAAFPHEYVVRTGWLPDSRRIAVQLLNRLQTELDLVFVERSTGAAQRILRETDTSWVNVFDDWHVLEKARQFLWVSERDGYTHLYRYTLDGKLVNRVTKGPWSLRNTGALLGAGQRVQAVDEKRGWVYYTSIEKSSLEQHLYRVQLDGTRKERLTREDGTHAIMFSPDLSHYLDRSSSGSMPSVITLCASDGTARKVLAGPRTEFMKKYDLQVPSYFTIPARDGFALPAMIFKPRDFSPTRTYPVIFSVYGGPSEPTVVNQWRGWGWENVLLENGYIVVSVDNRSATGMSHVLENLVLKNLMGEGELNDLVDAVRWVKQQPYVDSSRVGIWGWSGGGSFTMLGMTRSQEFAAGIAVAGVTDFRYYDTKFAEQYMKTEAENKDGFERSRLMNYAKDLHGRLLIVHGTHDDNVHIQNVWAFVDELIKANKRYELMLYPMRDHGIGDPAGRLHLYTTMLEFWKRNL